MTSFSTHIIFVKLEIVTILTSNHNISRTDIPMCKQRNTDSIPLIIEDDVWIYDNVFIIPSVRRIGKGSVLVANAIVTKDVEPYTVVGGNPAKNNQKKKVGLIYGFYFGKCNYCFL